jgi:hypothetical protein
MTGRFSDSSGWWVATLTLVGVGALLILVSTIDSGMGMAQRDSAKRESANSTDEIRQSGWSDDKRHPEGESDLLHEEILESDSLEERIRKKYGMVKRAGVWLRAIPLSADAVAAKLADVSVSGGKAETFALPLYITTGRLPKGQPSLDYRAKIDAVGGAPPYVWSLEKGNIGGTISLNQGNGELTGSPTKTMNESIRVRVTDSLGSADVAEFRFVVTEESVPETSEFGQSSGGLTPASTQPVTAQVETSLPNQTEVELNPDGEPLPPEEVELSLPFFELPEAKVGEAYSTQFIGKGGQAPYSYRTTSILPQGLALGVNGLLNGTPTEAGEYALIVSVTDQLQRVAVQNFSLKVKDADVPPVTQFRAVIGRSKVALTWASPTGLVRVVRNATNPPVHHEDGFVVYEGQGNMAIDPGLPFGGYYYAAFSVGDSGSVSVQPALLGLMLRADADPFADSLVSRQLLHPKAFNQASLPGIVLGAPRGGGYGAGSSDVVSLGAASVDVVGGAPYGGTITLAFTNNRVVDGPGADFTVFENVFYVGGDSNNRMMEPAIVSVSQDGASWFTFPVDFSPRFDPTTGALNLRHPYVYNRGFAGVNPVIANGVNVDATDPTVSGGDSFDLADLQVPGLSWVSFIRIQSTGDKWLRDQDGDLIHHPNGKDTFEANRNFNKSGFDLDAVSAIWLDAVE